MSDLLGDYAATTGKQLTDVLHFLPTIPGFWRGLAA
jgi:hypothetical protein